MEQYVLEFGYGCNSKRQILQSSVQMVEHYTLRWFEHVMRMSDGDYVN